MSPNERGYFESRLTDLLLGELSADEAAELRQAIEQDAELAAAYERLKQTVELVRQSATGPEEKPTSQPAPLRLSDDRRQKLLAQFKTVELKEPAPKKSRTQRRILELAAALAIIATLAAMLLPALQPAKQRAMRTNRMVSSDNRNYLGGGVESRANEIFSRPSKAAQAPVYAEPKLVPSPATPIVLPGTDEYANGNPIHVSPGAINSWSLDIGDQSFPTGNSRGIDIKSSGALVYNRSAVKDDSLDYSKTAGTFSVTTDSIHFGAAPGAAGLNIPDGLSPIRGSAIALPPVEANREVAQTIAANESAPEAPASLASVQYSQSRLLSQNGTDDAKGKFKVTLKEESAGEKQLAKSTPARIEEIEDRFSLLHRDVGDKDDLARYEAAKRELASAYNLQTLNERRGEQEKKPAPAQVPATQLKKEPDDSNADVAPTKAPAPTPVPQPEIQTRDNAFSTFSLNVSDVSFKLAAASLEKGVMPEAASIRTEEFINAFDYHDPEPAAGAPVAFVSERARYPFAHNRDLLRFSIKTAAAGRQAGRPLNLVLLLDNSGSMERADRVRIIQQALHVLAAQLQPQDKLSVVTFARTASLRIDGVSASQAADAMEKLSGLTPQGGTNLEDAMNLAYATALRHYLAGGINRVVLLTDGAANLGNVDPAALKQKVEANRKQGIALDCFGIGWEGYNDDLLEVLSRNGDGRYGFINSPDEAATEFASQLAGALKVAASDVKVQVEFNPKRVVSYRQIGYAKHQLTKEQFRDNTVDAAEIAAAESGNALYTIETNPAGEGPVGTVRVRYKVPGTTDYREQEWTVPFTGNTVALDQAGPALRLAATASSFSEWLASSPFASEITPDKLLNQLGNVPENYSADARPKKLEWMIRQAKSLSGK